MDEPEFWALIDGTDSPESLRAAVEALGDSELQQFDAHHRAACARAYDWGLWGAAYVIGGGCSDDLFMDFRAMLVGQGRKIYERALADPDGLTDVVLPDDADWEDWSSPALGELERRGLDWLPLEREGAEGAEGDEPGEPTGEEWEEDDLEHRFPRLCERYDW